MYMHWIFWVLIILATFTVMEGITWATHKYIMHGFLWLWHEDHHKPSGHFFEKNDLFFFVFAIPSWLITMYGYIWQLPWMAAMGYGISAYGLAYFLVHDVIIHQRFKWFSRSNNTYIRTLRWAHKMHHKHTGKHGGESFGFLFVAKKYWDKVKKDRELQKRTA
jgi:beta-carotene 3-hydroxylase